MILLLQADMLMEAMDVYDEELAKQRQAVQGKPVAPPHPLMLARGTDSPERFLLSSLAALRAPATRLGGGGAGLEHALGAITTAHARRLLSRLADWLSMGWEVELVGRAMRHLVTLHFGLIVNSAELRDVLHQSREARLNRLSKTKVISPRISHTSGKNIHPVESQLWFLVEDFPENIFAKVKYTADWGDIFMASPLKFD